MHTVHVKGADVSPIVTEDTVVSSWKQIVQDTSASSDKDEWPHGW